MLCCQCGITIQNVIVDTIPNNKDRNLGERDQSIHFWRKEEVPGVDVVSEGKQEEYKVGARSRMAVFWRREDFLVLGEVRCSFSEK